MRKGRKGNDGMRVVFARCTAAILTLVPKSKHSAVATSDDDQVENGDDGESTLFGGGIGALKFVRFIRILRMLKLLRIIKASR